MPPVPPPVDPSSREAEARAEIARTRVGRGAAWALAGLPVATLAFALAFESGAVARDDSRLFGALAAPVGQAESALVRWNGRLLAHAREIENRFDEGSAIARAIRPWGQLLLTAALRYGNEESYVGRERFLVYRADYDHLTARGDLAALGSGDPVRAALAFADALARRDVALVLLPVPVKPSIEPDRFSLATPEPPLRSPRDDAFADALAAARAPLHRFDASALLTVARRNGGAYLDTDTHWRPEAMDDVARELAMRLRALADLPIGADPPVPAQQLDVEGRGDGVALLGLPDAFPFYGREAVRTAPVPSAAGGPWQPTRGAPVLLLGDSFSAIYSRPELGFGASAGLAERLSVHLGLPVDRILENAGGASATREALARDPTRLDGVRVVVWQFAARELTLGDWRETPID